MKLDIDIPDMVFVATQADAGMKPRTSAILLLVDTLDVRNVQRLVDVRTIPRSRHNP